MHILSSFWPFLWWHYLIHVYLFWVHSLTTWSLVYHTVCCPFHSSVLLDGYLAWYDHLHFFDCVSLLLSPHVLGLLAVVFVKCISWSSKNHEGIFALSFNFIGVLDVWTLAWLSYYSIQLYSKLRSPLSLSALCDITGNSFTSTWVLHFCWFLFPLFLCLYHLIVFVGMKHWVTGF